MKKKRIKLMLKIYISGKMSGCLNFNYYQFFKKEKEIKKILKCEIVNPAYIGLEYAEKKNKNLEDIPKKEFLENDLKYIETCDIIYMMTGWENSEGAKEELEHAKKYGLVIMYESKIMIN
jgi:hypothetical protein